MTTVDIKMGNWNEYAEPSRKIRHTVFIEEQSVPIKEEWDTDDEHPETQHFIAFIDGAPVGCLRLINKQEGKVKLTRLAVLKPYRQKKIATALLKAGIHHALSKKIEYIFLHAQTQALRLYKKLAFIQEGDTFLEAGIEHQKMFFDSRNAEQVDAYYADSVIRLDHTNNYIQHISQMATITRRSLSIVSDQLRADIFGDSEVVDALSQFARHDRHAHIRVLIQTTEALDTKYSPLIALARRLPTKISIKVLGESIEQAPESALVFDQRRLIYFNDEKQCIGFCCYQAKAECQQLTNKFEHLWAHQAQTHANFSQLFL